jgi:hypothetical protein
MVEGKEEEEEESKGGSSPVGENQEEITSETDFIGASGAWKAGPELWNPC